MDKLRTCTHCLQAMNFFEIYGILKKLETQVIRKVHGHFLTLNKLRKQMI